MFQKTRLQLTLAYLAVLTFILALFTVAVRWNFTLSLNQQFNIRLENLAKAAAFNMDNEDGKLEADDDEILVNQEQIIEWFDLDGQIVEKQGNYPFTIQIPFNTKYLEQIQNYPHSIRSLVKPVNHIETGELIGYVRVSESLAELHNTLRRLDYGLGSGMAIALLTASLGSLWLTSRAMKPIEASFDRLKHFTADASHELRSPLMAIKTNADVALKYPEGMRTLDAEKFIAISSASNQMTKLTENLLFLARTDRVITLQKEPLDLSLLLTELTQLYRIQAEVKKISLQAQLKPELYILGDRILLKQLFTNLLENALHYTPAEGSVIINSAKINSYVQINIKDTGIGIAPENLDKIFERFWRADRSRSYQSDKLGLGLAIVQEIVRLHNGTISVDSKLQKGSCFRLSFLGE